MSCQFTAISKYWIRHRFVVVIVLFHTRSTFAFMTWGLVKYWNVAFAIYTEFRNEFVTRQIMYCNVTLWRIRVTVVAVEM